MVGKNFIATFSSERVARRKGFEPLTPRFEVSDSFRRINHIRNQERSQGCQITATLHFLSHSLSLSPERAIMTRHEQSASAVVSASTLLPTANVIPLPAANRSVHGVFTKATVRRMQCNSGKQEKFFWDAACRGFGIRALRSGQRSWIYQYRDEHGRTRRIVLGNVSAVSLEDARAAARRTAASVAQGTNPSVERKKKRSTGTVLQVIEAYLPQAKGRQRPRSYKETERYLRIHAASIHRDRAEAVRRRDISALLERVAESRGPIAANRLRAALSALWSWGLRTGLIEADSSPVAFTVRQPEKTRERTLNDVELKAIWKETDDNGDYSRIVRLCLLTGCRREEIGGLRWDEIQSERIVFGAGRMKGKLAHEIPLLPLISAAVPKRLEDAEGCVFGRRGKGYAGFSKSKKKFDAKLAKSGVHIAPWGLHDLRRTFSTRLHDAGVEPLVIEALLAHKQQGVAAVYNRASFREAKRSALIRWHEILGEILQDGELVRS
ncbi:MAG: integrase arm-type DNA-binding domain-containing protein [Pseudolabrys sp.]